MRLLITGATNLVGRCVIKRLLICNELDYRYYLLLNPYSEKNAEIDDSRLTKLYCDLKEVDSIAKYISDVKPSLILHMAQMKFSGALIKAMSLASSQARIITVGSTKIYSNIERIKAPYEFNEACIKQSHYRYTIIRPTMIYGSVRDRNMHKLINRIKMKKIIPLINDGNTRYQPIHIKDVAKILLIAIHDFDDQNYEIDIGGPRAYTTEEIIKLCSKELSIEARIIKINIFILLKGLKMLKWLNKVERIYDLLRELIRDKNIHNKNYCDKIENMISLEKGIEELVKDMR